MSKNSPGYLPPPLPLPSYLPVELDMKGPCIAKHGEDVALRFIDPSISFNKKKGPHR